MIIYLHGFNSTGQSAKGQYLKQHLHDIRVLTPTYHYQPQQAITDLQELVQSSMQHSERLLLVGSSLGGYYAQYLSRQFDINAVLINPALQPMITLDNYLGENTNFYSGETYTITRDDLDVLKSFDVAEPCPSNTHILVLLDKADEVLDYRVAEQRYRPCANVICFDDGDHQFQHLAESLAPIRALYATSELT